MLTRIKDFFENYLNPQLSEADTEKQLQFAAAALFLEMMAMDDKVEDLEQEMLRKLLQDKFSMSGQEAEEFINVAGQQREKATDYFEFTSLINKSYSQEQKIELVRMLWTLAYADGRLDVNEEYLVRKIADLLHVPHPAFIQAKNQVSEGKS